MKYKVLESRNMEELMLQFKEFEKDYIVINKQYYFWAEVGIHKFIIRYVEKDLWRHA